VGRTGADREDVIVGRNPTRDGVDRAKLLTRRPAATRRRLGQPEL
jgi:hypothetical protein